MSAPTSTAPAPTRSFSAPRFTPVLWPLLLIIHLALGLTYSVIQPFMGPPDETAHVQYAQFLANNGHFPVFNPVGGGEAGYESQHPPLYYAAAALVYKIATPLPENWRWQVLRWSTLLVGVALFFVCRRFFSEMWPQRPWLAWTATATVLWMPLTLLYVGYVNPDGLVLLWMALALRSSVRAAQAPVTTRQSLWLGVWCALALLTKLSGAPALVIACLAQVWAGKERLGTRLGATLGPVLLLAGPWYGRNLWHYGSPFIHTQGHLGTGLQYAARAGFGEAAWLAWRETFLSTWAQRGWFTPGIDTIFYGLIILGVGLAAVGLVVARRRKTARHVSGAPPLREALNLSGLVIVLVFAGQQWAYWTQDVEFNAGGRYMLATMTAIALVLVAGWDQLGTAARKFWIPLWLVVLLVMNAVSIDNIVHVLNPRYVPGWRMFEFPPGH